MTLNITDLLRRALTLMRNAPLTYLSLGGLMSIPSILIRWVGHSSPLLILALSVFQMGWMAWLMAGVSAATERHDRGLSCSVTECLTQVRSRLPLLIVATFRIGVLSALGLMFFILPGIYLITRYWTVIPAAALEQPERKDVFRLNQHLIEGHTGSLFMLVLLIWIIPSTLLIFAWFPDLTSGFSAKGLFLTLAGLLVFVLNTTVATLAYLRLRELKGAALPHELGDEKAAKRMTAGGALLRAAGLGALALIGTLILIVSFGLLMQSKVGSQLMETIVDRSSPKSVILLKDVELSRPKGWSFSNEISERVFVLQPIGNRPGAELTIRSPLETELPPLEEPSDSPEKNTALALFRLHWNAKVQQLKDTAEKSPLFKDQLKEMLPAVARQYQEFTLESMKQAVGKNGRIWHQASFSHQDGEQKKSLKLVFTSVGSADELRILSFIYGHKDEKIQTEADELEVTKIITSVRFSGLDESPDPREFF